MITGDILRDGIISGANNLSNRRAKVDELNVFPVPDGDTGTNMSMTIGRRRGRSCHGPCPTTALWTRPHTATASAMLRGARGQLRRYHQPAVPRLFQGARRAKRPPTQGTLWQALAKGRGGRVQGRDEAHRGHHAHRGPRGRRGSRGQRHREDAVELWDAGGAGAAERALDNTPEHAARAEKGRRGGRGRPGPAVHLRGHAGGL